MRMISPGGSFSLLHFGNRCKKKSFQSNKTAEFSLFVVQILMSVFYCWATTFPKYHWSGTMCGGLSTLL